MAGRISGLNWQAGGYVNPAMPQSVVDALAAQGLNPDGSLIAPEAFGAATRRRLAAGAQAIAQGKDVVDGQLQRMGLGPVGGMSYTPSLPESQRNIFEGANSPWADTGDGGAPAFGAETRAKQARFQQVPDAEGDRIQKVVDALINSQPEAPEQASASPMPTIRAMPVSPIGGFPAAAKAKAQEDDNWIAPPRPKARPKPAAYTVKAGDNPSTIAKSFGMSLKELEQKNPGILRKARRLKVGSTLKV